MKSSGENTHLLQVNGSFWPLFFTSRLMTRLIGGCTCFCLSDDDNGQQTILVVPESARASIPSVSELLNNFPIRSREDRRFRDPSEIPASYANLRNTRLLGFQEIRTKQRTVRIITPERRFHQATEEVASLMFVRFWEASTVQIGRLNVALGEARVWYQSVERRDARVLIFLQPGENIRFKGSSVALNFDELPTLVTVPNKGLTA